MAEPLTMQEQVAIADAKMQKAPEDKSVDRFDRPNMTAEQHLQKFADFKEEFPDYAKGLPSNVAGIPVDLLILLAGGLAGARNYVVDGTPFSFVLPDDWSEVPGSSASLGKLVGADPDSIGFILSAFSNVESGAVAAIKAYKAYAGLTKVAGVAQASLGGMLAARNVPGKLADQITAEKMLNAGAKNDEIFQQTGWLYDAAEKPGSRWKFWVSDKNATVNMTKIEKRAADAGIEIGEEFSVKGRMDEFLEHPDYYEAFPQFADTPTEMFVRRIADKNGKPQFEVFNQNAFDNKIAGQVSETLSGKKLDIFGSATGRWDNARTVLLHEANHLPQAAEGFDQGANSAKFLDRIQNAAENAIQHQVAQDLASGVLHKGMSGGDRVRYANEIRRTHRTTTSKRVFDRINRILSTDFEPEVIAQFASDIGRTHQRSLRDVALMMEELGDVPKGKAADEILDALTKMTTRDQTDLATRRYRNQGGEIGSRLTEHFENMTAAEMRAAGATPDLEGQAAANLMSKGDPVIGDAAQAARKADEPATLEDFLINDADLAEASLFPRPLTGEEAKLPLPDVSDTTGIGDDVL